MKDNTNKKELPAIETFTCSSASTIVMLKKPHAEIFERLEISHDPAKVAKKLEYVLQVTTGHIRDKLVDIFKKVGNN